MTGFAARNMIGRLGSAQIKTQSSCLYPARMEKTFMPAKVLSLGRLPKTLTFKAKNFHFLSARGDVFVSVPANANGSFDPEAVALRLSSLGKLNAGMIGMKILAEIEDEEITKKLLEVSRVANLVQDALRLPLSNITHRQRQVFDSIMRGEANKQTAVVMGCTVRTVKFHVSKLLDKLSCSSRQEIYTRYYNQIVEEKK